MAKNKGICAICGKGTKLAGPLARFVGLSGELNIEKQQMIYQTELAHPPFAYLLTIDSEPSQPISDVTEWTTRDYSEERDERVEMIVVFGHTGLPGDYRSKAMVEAEAAGNIAALNERQRTEDAE